jgi:hypothetical protein
MIVLLEFYPVSLLVQGDHAFDLVWLMVANINPSDNNVMVRDTWVGLTTDDQATTMYSTLLTFPPANRKYFPDEALAPLTSARTVPVDLSFASVIYHLTRQPVVARPLLGHPAVFRPLLGLLRKSII